jgi:hypothetical protein
VRSHQGDFSILLKTSGIAAICMVTLVSFDAWAVPASLFPPEQQHSYITQVAGGCGLGWHRGPWGGCRRNWGGWGPTLLVPANSLGPSPGLPLVEYLRFALESPAYCGVFYAFGLPFMGVSRGKSPANLFYGSTITAIRTYMKVSERL